MMDELYGPLMFVLGGAAALAGVGLYVLTIVPRPRLFGFSVEQEGRSLHDMLAGKK